MRRAKREVKKRMPDILETVLKIVESGAVIILTTGAVVFVTRGLEAMISLL